jgi:hypothetical protein
LFKEDDLTENEENEIIEKIATEIHKNGLETLAVFILESIKPLSYFGGQMSRIFASPFFTLAGEDADILGQKLISIFEKKENVDKLIEKIEEIKANE